MRKTALLISLCFGFAELAQAVTVSVKPGDPVATLTSELGAGDQVVFTDGTYVLEEGLVWGGTGTQDQPITLKAQNPGMAVLQLVAGSYVAEIVDGTWIQVEGLIFEGSADYLEQSYGGLRVRTTEGLLSSNIIVQDCEIRNVGGSGLRVDGDASSLTIERNHIHDTGNGTGINIGTNDASYWLMDSVIAQNQVHQIGGDYAYGIYLANGSQGNIIRDNVVYGISYRGMFVGSTESGAANEILGNIIWQANDTGLWLEGAAVVQNNVIFDIEGDGIRSNNDDAREGLDNQIISHNTVVNTTDDAVQLSDWFFRSGMVFANNVVANPTGYGFDFDDDYTEYDTTTNYIANNVVTGLVDGYDPALYPGWVLPGAGFADFVDVENWDFYPSSTALTINSGDASAEAWVPVADFNGAPRDGAAPDVGAYEWDGDGNPGWTVQEGFKELGFDGTGDSHDVGSGGCCGGGKKDGESDGGEALFFLPLLSLGWLRRRRA